MTQGPVVRISRGRFEPTRYEEVSRLLGDSEIPLRPAIEALRGLIYYHVAADKDTSTIVNVSIWEDASAAGQMETLGPMLAQRPILEKAGVQFDRVANYEPLWTIGSVSRPPRPS